LLHLGNPEYFIEKSEGVTQGYARTMTPMGVLGARVVNKQAAWVPVLSHHCHETTKSLAKPHITMVL